MRRATTLTLLLVLGACEARISGAPGNPEIDGGTGGVPIDGALSIDGPGLVTLGPWSDPIKIPSASTGASEEDITMSSDGLELFFAINPTNAMDTSGRHLYYTSRPSASGAWSQAIKLPFNGTTTSDEAPRLSSDNLTLYFASGRAGNGNLDVYKVTRDAPGSLEWRGPDLVTSVSTTTQSEKWFSPCQGDRFVMVQNLPDAATHLVEGTIGGPAPTPIAVNSTASDTGAFVTPDCLTLYFASTRSGTTRIYRSTRAAAGVAWTAPANRVTDFAALGGAQEDPWISPDGTIFAFVSDVEGDKDVYIATRSAVIGVR